MTPRELQVFNHLAQFVSEHKKQFIDKVLGERTRHLTIVLENIYQSQNASAVVRTCECMGIQDVHIIENTAKYLLNVRVLKGAYKWMNMERYNERGVNNTETCYKKLRDNGYKILVADPDPDGVSIHEVDVDQKLAVVFGNELRGVSSYALAHADQKVRIPMYGFTESLNISVSAAICVNSVINRFRSSGVSFGLSEAEKESLKLEWYRKVVKRSDLIEREFLRAIE
ncbi:TrmH family RNA methyltransferase [Pseudochryseolinea flava]|uniref:tRNA (guanosine(18)-2'-O)-methyltransferase n=1 Tax=Pseudochryseolinea flava TaxID=2059302 RepID=A0A364XUK1_9BACT|nr:RNA methyltransferase [Pseudochryseolinea flava]RAV97819.1 TrmH family RNA methyltransferase [Pseudochryseolinea flava]